MSIQLSNITINAPLLLVPLNVVLIILIGLMLWGVLLWRDWFHRRMELEVSNPSRMQLYDTQLKHAFGNVGGGILILGSIGFSIYWLAYAYFHLMYFISVAYGDQARVAAIAPQNWQWAAGALAWLNSLGRVIEMIIQQSTIANGWWFGAGAVVVLFGVALGSDNSTKDGAWLVIILGLIIFLIGVSRAILFP